MNRSLAGPFALVSLVNLSWAVASAINGNLLVSSVEPTPIIALTLGLVGLGIAGYFRFFSRSP